MKYLLSILIVLCKFSAWTQDFELFKIQSTYYPAQAVKESSLDGEVGFWEWSGQLAIPQLLKRKKMILIHKVGYANLRVETDGIFGNTAMESSKDYHTISYNLGMIKILGPKWRLIANLIPSLVSDFSEPLSSEDLLLQGNVMAIKAKSLSFKYGFGITFTTRFGRQLVIPTALLKYDTQKMSLDFQLPNKLSLMHKSAQDLNLGFEAVLDGGLFNNNSEVQIVSNLIDKAAYSRINLGPRVVFKLKKAIDIYMTGGVAVGRRLEFIDSTGETLNRTPDHGPFFRLGISFNPKGRMAETFLKN